MGLAVRVTRGLRSGQMLAGDYHWPGSKRNKTGKFDVSTKGLPLCGLELVRSGDPSFKQMISEFFGNGRCCTKYPQNGVRAKQRFHVSRGADSMKRLSVLAAVAALALLMVLGFPRFRAY